MIVGIVSFVYLLSLDHSKLPTLYWLPKLHKRPYKSRFIAKLMYHY